MLERPFVNLTPEYSVSTTDVGLTLHLRVPGHPKSARIFGRWTLGAVKALERFVHDATVGTLSIAAHTVADRSEVRVRFRGRSQEVELTTESPPTSVRTQKRQRSGSRSLHTEVQRILGNQPTVPAFKAPDPQPAQPESSRYSVTHPGKRRD
jgi:hypothetical protein